MLLKNIKPDELGMPDVTNEIRLSLHRKYAKPYILYRKHKTYVDCYCTHCMKRYRLYLDAEMITPGDVQEHDTARVIHHDMPLICKNCGCEAVARAEKISRASLVEYHNICYFFVEENAVYAVCGVLTCGYGYKQPIDEMEAVYGGSEWTKFYVMEYTPNNARLIARSWYGNFGETEKIIEPHLNGGMYSASEYFYAANPEVLKDSFLRYVIPPEYSSPGVKSCAYEGAHPLKFMAYAVKYPAVEMLLKIGGKKLVYEIVDRDKPCKRVINLEGKTVAEVFRTDGNDAAIIRKAIYEHDIDLSILQCWYRIKSIARREKRKCKFDDALMICRFNNVYQESLNLIAKTGLTPTKYENYLMRQAEHYKECPRTLEITYKDYIRECEELGYNVKDTQVCKPAELYTAHERTSGLLRAIHEEQARKAAKKKEREYLKRREKLCEMYEYSDKNYKIIIPVSALDIAEEGKRLCHCVGGYAQRHIEGKLTILFMRDTHFLDIPLYTIEMQGNNLRQIHGKKNCTPTEKAMKFVSKWLEWVRLPEAKKHPKAAKKKTSAA